VYTHYYQHVYQITGIIRGRPLITLSESEKQRLFDMFDTIHESWERHKSVMSPDRSNFMANAVILQMFFRILGYPPHIVNMFNQLKGTENIADYDRICEIICKENGWKFESFSSIACNKITGGKTIVNMFSDQFEEEEN